MSKIMLIEDDRTMVDLLKTLLSIEGYEVVAFHGSEELLPAIRRENPDVGVRWESGFELLTALREDQDLCRIGVIISSGMNYQEESRTAGADGFIMKPYMPDDLLNLIKTTLS